MRGRTRLLLGSLVLCAAFLLTAYKGTLDWLGIMAFAAVFGLPEAAKILKLFVKRKDCDAADPD